MGRATRTSSPTAYQKKISIHALRGEGDSSPVTRAYSPKNFNPRPPWGGRHPPPSTSFVHRINFNPRPPWGGRRYRPESRGSSSHFNPRPPWGGRRNTVIRHFNAFYISIHALRGEGDASPQHGDSRAHDFNPRPPWGGRRQCRTRLRSPSSISIHALRGEGDEFNFFLPGKAVSISIHALRGEGD